MPGLTGPPPGEAQASLSHRSRGLAAQSAWRAEGAGRPEPSSRPTRRRRSRPVGQPAPEGNDSGGQHRRPACRRRRRRIASRARHVTGEFSVLAAQLTPPSVLLKTLNPVPAYRVVGVSGSMAKALATGILNLLQVTPPSVLLKVPASSNVGKPPT